MVPCSYRPTVTPLSSPLFVAFLRLCIWFCNPNYPLPRRLSSYSTYMYSNYTGYPLKWFQIRVPNSVLTFARLSLNILVLASVCPQVCNPQSNSQTECENQKLETVQRSLTSHNPSSCSQQLPWVESSINSLCIFFWRFTAKDAPSNTKWIGRAMVWWRGF